jgi:hypothetical protein
MPSALGPGGVLTQRVCFEHHGWHIGVSCLSVALSPSTALYAYIPFDVFYTYFSTSHIRCTSFTSRVASGYGDGTPGMLAGRRYGLYACFSAPAGRGKEPGAAPKPPLKLVELIIFRSRLIAKQGPLAIHRAMRSSYPLSFLLLPHRASQINSPL